MRAASLTARGIGGVDPVVQISLFVKLKLTKCVRRAQSLYCAATPTLWLGTDGTADWRNKAIAPYEVGCTACHNHGYLLFFL
jgi:hypothetical protein